MNQPDSQQGPPEQTPPPPPQGYSAAPGAIEGEQPAPPPPSQQPPVAPGPPPPTWGARPAAGFGAPGANPPPPQYRPQPPQAAAPRPVYPPTQQPPPPSGSAAAPPPGYAPPQQQPPYGYRPQPAPGYGGYPPPAPRGRSRALPIVIGLVIFLFLLVGGAVTLVASMSGGSGTTTGGGGFGLGVLGSRIGILEIEGVIGEGAGYGANTALLVQQVKTWTKNSSIKAIVIRVNSPGGAVSATQDLFAALNDFRASGEKGAARPIIVSMGDIAASGGYYAAMAADKVFANEGTLTGSVGVIMSFYDYQGLQDKIGVHGRTVKSGEFKDMGSGSRDMTEAEKALLDEMVGDVYGQFFDAVVEARADRVREILNPTSPSSVTIEEVRAHLAQYCDGRIFSGQQAQRYGMIDELGTLDAAVQEAAKLTGLSATDTPTIRGPVKPTPGLFGLSGMMQRMESIPDKLHGSVKMEYRFAGF